jgi:hypothetical protein
MQAEISLELNKNVASLLRAHKHNAQIKRRAQHSDGVVPSNPLAHLEITLSRARIMRCMAAGCCCERILCSLHRYFQCLFIVHNSEVLIYLQHSHPSRHASVRRGNNYCGSVAVYLREQRVRVFALLQFIALRCD